MSFKNKITMKIWYSISIRSHHIQFTFPTKPMFSKNPVCEYLTSWCKMSAARSIKHSLLPHFLLIAKVSMENVPNLWSLWNKLSVIKYSRILHNSYWVTANEISKGNETTNNAVVSGLSYPIRMMGGGGVTQDCGYMDNLKSGTFCLDTHTMIICSPNQWSQDVCGELETTQTSIVTRNTYPQLRWRVLCHITIWRDLLPSVYLKVFYPLME